MTDKEVRLVFAVLRIPYIAWQKYMVGKTVSERDGEKIFDVQDVQRYIRKQKPALFSYKYLVIPQNADPFATPFFERENHFVGGMTVIDQVNLKFTHNGTDWEEIHQDHL